MPSNSVKINNFDDLEWEVSDSKMELLISLLNEIGTKKEYIKETENKEEVKKEN